MTDWIDLDHTLTEWLLFAAVIAVLLGVRAWARRQRRRQEAGEE